MIAREPGEVERLRTAHARTGWRREERAAKWFAYEAEDQIAPRVEVVLRTPVACDECAGSGAKPGTKRKQCGTCGGVGQVSTSRGFVMFTQTCPECAGEGTVVKTPCTACKGAGAVEKTRGFRGRYHVLGGALDPLSGVGPEQLRIRELLNRIGERVDGVDVTEVIIATDPNTEGEATALYVAERIREAAPGARVTRLAHGLPVGGDLEYADEVTLGRAFAGRRSAR